MARQKDQPDTPNTPDTPVDTPHADDFVEGCFSDAYALREEKTNLQDRIKANRDILRTLHTAGKLSDAAVTELNELYPPRAAKKDGDDITPDDNGNGAGTPDPAAATGAAA